MVETAITMPLFVFIILGSLQLALAHQARLMAKYAAFKAARAGALHHAKKGHMERAAAAVLAPTISYSSGGKDFFVKTKDAMEYAVKAPLIALNKSWFPALPIVEVTICSPTTSPNASGKGMTSSQSPSSGKASGQVVGFDLPDTQLYDDYNGFLKTQLAIQVEYNYRMPIPFANMMIYHIFNGTEGRGLQEITRTHPNSLVPMIPFTSQKGSTSGVAGRTAARFTGQYFIPIRTWYAMRMQSDLFPNGISKLPAQNKCVVPDGQN
jgi:hypothetical protein